MEITKYRCSRCEKIFEIAGPRPEGKPVCPVCLSEDIEDYDACLLKIGPPPWEYQCRQCDIRFRVPAPSGPKEAELIRCPLCRKEDIKWMLLSTQGCATGG
jgi:DNA-directed RNA polymerase subunit RPC12/RpoP